MAAARFALLSLFLAFLPPPAAATDRVLSLGDFCNGADTADDTTCIQAWLSTAQAKGARDLYVPPGVFLYSKRVALPSNMHIRCAGPGASIFRNGRSADGTPRPGDLFSATSPVHNVIVENCGFDVRGGSNDFLAVISINAEKPSTNIHVRGNRFYDSAAPKPYSTPQRQYVVLLGCNDCWVENNILTHGGRIKVGRPGQRLFIRGNVVQQTNDNAITVVDVPGGLEESQHVLIDGNVVLEPKGVGIFFGADGQKAADADMRAFNVTVSRNVVRGDWEIACIRGVAPSQSRRLHVVENQCVKLGTKGAAGIDLLRPDGTHPRAEDVLVGFNTVAGEKGVLDAGGIFVRGGFKGLRIVGNSVRDIGARAIRFSGADVQDALVAGNILAGGGIVILGNFSGAVSDNLLLQPAGLGLQIQMAAGERITASIRQNVIRASADSCINFNGPGAYEVDLVDNTLASCGGSGRVTFFGGADLAPGSARRHNQGDAAPHAAPTRHLTVVASWPAGTLAAGASQGINVSVPGAEKGHIAGASLEGIPADNFQLSAHVVATNTVRVVVTNHTAASASLGGALRVHVWRFD